MHLYKHLMKYGAGQRQPQKPGLSKPSRQQRLFGMGSDPEGPGLMAWLITIAILTAFLVLVLNLWNVSTY